ncbi:hypothetical protein [Sphingopyxis sp.]|uniref:hypothetical protein n=1 Tax=Sphingopyxis sp. TaxID=1908224 RepID=UPI003D13FB1D
MLRVPFVLAPLLTATVAAAQPPAPPAPPPPDHRGFMLADVDGDGRVTLDELETLLHARFSVLDADSDGQISIEQLKQTNGGGPRGPRVAGTFRGPPPGGPGGRPPGPPPGPPPGGAHPDGAHPNGPPPPPDMGGGFPFPQPEDSNGDGFISRAEFVAPAAAMLDAWDRDRDGAVTASEAPDLPSARASDPPRKGE